MFWLVVCALVAHAYGQEKIPKIIMDEEDYYGFPEQFKYLRVQTNNVPDAQYRWLKDDKEITKDNQPPFYDPHQTQLLPSAVNKDSIEYAGIYQFVMKAPAGTIKGRKITVAFTYVGKFDPNLPKDYTVDVVVGQANFVHCPKHQLGSNVIYKWGKQTSAQGTKFMESKPNHIVLDNGTLFYSHLTEADVRRFNENAWRCGMEAKSEGSTKFAWADRVHTQFRKIDTNMTEFGPQIVTMLPQDYRFQEGDTISMKCAAAGRPTPQYSWKRVDVYGKEFDVVDGKDGITFDDGDPRLIVMKKATRNHAGRYFCTATIGNKNNTVEGSLSYQVKPQWIAGQDIKSVAPSILSSHSWTCNATGFPMPTYNWHKNGEELVSSATHVIKGGTLTFPVLQKEDTGMYECVADNGLNNIYQTAYLDVQAEKPVFDSNIGKQTLFLGAKGVIKCHAKAAPAAKNTWTKDGVDIDFSAPRYTLVDDEDLVIDKVGKHDIGNYTCIAKNQYGDDRKKISVQVVGEITFVEKPKDVNTTRGKQVKLKCKAEGDKESPVKATIKYKWKYNGEDIDSDDSIIWSDRAHSLVFLNAQVSQSGVYECIAYIDKPSYAEKTSKASVVIRGPPEAPNKVAIDGDCSSFSAKLMWHITSTNYEPIKSFVIQMMTTYDDPTKNPWRNISDSVPASDYEKTISGLSPYTKYRFRVLAINEIGTSAPSEPTSFEDCLTPQRAPTKCPKITAIPGKENELTLKWEEMKAIDHNGKNFEYRLEYSSSKPKISGKKSLTPVEVEFKIPNAGYYRPWTFKIQGYNDIGGGPFCEGDSFSGQNAPNLKPLDLTVKEFSDVFLVLQWKEIGLGKGSVDGYKVKYYQISSSTKTRRSIGAKNCDQNNPCTEDVVGSRRTTVRLEGLIPFTNYRISVRGYNSGGLGPESSITADTSPGLPGAPQAKVTPYSKFIKIQWEPPRRSHGIIVNYKVSIDKDATPSQAVVPGTAREHVFGGLDPEKGYIVTIQAKTVVGYGEKAVFDTRTKALQIPAIPATPVLKGFGEDGVNVTFKEGEPTKGFPERFLVFYRVKDGEDDTWNEEGPVELFGPESKPYLEINGLDKTKEYEMVTVALNEEGRSNISDIATVKPGNKESNAPIAQSTAIYKRSWFVAIVVIVCLLLIILLIALLITRKRGERYPVGKREKKRAGIMDVGEEPDLGGYPMKPSRHNGNGMGRQNSTGSYPNKDPDRDSLDAYEEDRFDEDAASLIGAYNDDRKPNKTVEEPEFV